MRKLLDAGPRYALAILASRVVPSWLLRNRKFIVFQLEPPAALVPERKLRQNRLTAGSADPVKNYLQMRWATTAAETDAAIKLTGASILNDETRRRVATAWIDGRLVGAIWCAREFFDETDLGLRIVLGPSQRWLYSAQVVSDLRRQGIYRRLIEFIVQDHSAYGSIQWLLSINPWNRRSMLAHSAIGVSEMGKARAFRLAQFAGCTAEGQIRMVRQLTWNLNKAQTSISIG